MTTRILIDLFVIVPLVLFILALEWAKQNPAEGSGGANTNKEGEG